MNNYDYCIINNDTPDINSSLSFLSTLNLFVFYGLFIYSFKHLINLHYKNNKTTLTYYCSDIIKSKNDTDNDDYKNELFHNLLSLNSINRCYLLYYIFKRKGDFKTLIINNKTNKPELNTYNTYNLFTKVKDNYNLSSTEFNLDETQSPDTIITIGSETHTLTLAQLKFIQWIYYTGIYDYLMNNNNIKYDILNEMNENNLLDGNLFLRYQLFLCQYEEECINDINDDTTDESNDNVSDESNDNVSDESNDNVSDESNDNVSDESNDNVTDESNNTTDESNNNDITDESNDTPDESNDTTDESNNNDITDESEEDTNYDIENDIELNKYNILLDTINFTDIIKTESYKEINKLKKLIGNFI